MHIVTREPQRSITTAPPISRKVVANTQERVMVTAGYENEQKSDRSSPLVVRRRSLLTFMVPSSRQGRADRPDEYGGNQGPSPEASRLRWVGTKISAESAHSIDEEGQIVRQNPIRKERGASTPTGPHEARHRPRTKAGRRAARRRVTAAPTKVAGRRVFPDPSLRARTVDDREASGESWWSP